MVFLINQKKDQHADTHDSEDVSVTEERFSDERFRYISRFYSSRRSEDLINPLRD